jgi:hypothetical protein
MLNVAILIDRNEFARLRPVLVAAVASQPG